MLENDAARTKPDVLKSTDGGLTFTPDTIGLHSDQFGTDYVTAMIYHNGKLYLAFNYVDIYEQGVGSTSIKKYYESNTKAYPNPFTKTINIETDYPITSIVVMNTMGKVVLKEEPMLNSHILTLNHVPSGIYYIMYTSNDIKQSIKVVKR